MIRKKSASTNDSPPALMAAGTFVVDYHKVIDHYPDQRGSATVKREMVSNGGAPFNLLLALAKLKVDFPLVAAGKVGRDLDGNMVLDECRKHGIDTTQLQGIEDSSTGYTDVFTVETSGRHTCFHYRGIGDTFRRKDIKLRAVAPKILFLGSLGALGKMDQYHRDFGRRGATQLIRDARKQGITTVIEISPTHHRAEIADYLETIKETDYLIINDRLTERLTDTEVSAEGQFDPELGRQAAQQFLDHGLRKAVIVHAGIAAISLHRDGTFAEESAQRLPPSQRAGSAGVDHAFSAGFLEGLYHQKDPNTCLQQGLAVANACRTHLTPSGGILPLADCLRSFSPPHRPAAPGAAYA